MFYIPVQGTASWDDAWWKKDSPFARYMASLGHNILRPDDPFMWSTDLDGTQVIRWVMRQKPSHRDWEAGGRALSYYLETVPLKDRNLIAHSHGLQVVLYLATRVKINTLISVAGPSRRDMDTVVSRARPNINFWVHAFDQGWDAIAFFGQMFDGRWFGGRDHKLADMNIPLEDINHSKLLKNPAYFHHFKDSILPLLTPYVG